MVQQQQGMPPPPKPEKKDAFSDMFKHKEAAPQGPSLGDVRGNVNNLERRLRVLEGGFTNIRKTLQVTEQNMLSKNKIFSTEIKTLTSEVHDLKKEISKIKEKMLELIKELESAAKVSEVKVLEKYINLWNPVKFVTNKEVERIIEEKLEKFK